ncbi:MAG: 50S ribosomal protein L29 [Armatimonadetes bacterium]|nr:50S ribosomal protein L29 [Armatimonadota bacterium]
MKTQELRELTPDELARRMDQFSQELFNLRLQSTLGKDKNAARVCEVRRTIARIKTVMAEKAEKGLRS